MSKSGLFFIFIAVYFFSGCASMFGDKNHTISITSTPPGAYVEYGGQNFGTTPTDIIIKNTFNPSIVHVSKPQYKTENREVQTGFQVVGILNIFFWPGFVIDAATGNMMSVDEHHMNFVLKPE